MRLFVPCVVALASLVASGAAYADTAFDGVGGSGLIRVLPMSDGLTDLIPPAPPGVPMEFKFPEAKKVEPPKPAKEKEAMDRGNRGGDRGARDGSRGDLKDRMDRASRTA